MTAVDEAARYVSKPGEFKTMNYAEARPLLDGSGWHWTTMRDKVVRTAWPCDEGSCQHDTQEDAERHFYDACLAMAKEYSASLSECAVNDCEEGTRIEIGHRFLGRTPRPIPLCDKHRSVEQLRELYPFRHGLQLIHS